jgi:DNA-binding MarR family transcriptional regulator
MMISYESLYKFIKGYKEEHEYPPTQQEIAEGFGVTQPAIAYHLQRLEKLGLCKRDGRHRISLTEL